MASTIQKYKDLLNAHDVDGVRALGNPDTKIELGGLVMDFTGEYLNVLVDTYASFPDVQFAGEIVAGEGGDKKIYWKNLQYKGTHTGAPYGIGSYPKIVAKGTYCCGAIEEMEFIVEHGKIVHAKLIPTENGLSGPPFFYTQIGGTLDNTKE
jgi:hypothetical protein